jgi:hypothetical protein
VTVGVGDGEAMLIINNQSARSQQKVDEMDEWMDDSSINKDDALPRLIKRYTIH